MPAAAVIPAPIAYMKVVAVKKLVVGFRIVWDVVRRNGVFTALKYPFLGESSAVEAVYAVLYPLPIVYFEKIRVFKAGVTRPLNTVSMG